MNCEQPSESNAELFLVALSKNLFWCCQLLVAGHMFCCSHKVLRGECRDTRWVKALYPRLRSQPETYQRIGVHGLNGAPECEEFGGRYENARLIEEISRKTGSAQYLGN